MSQEFSSQSKILKRASDCLERIHEEYAPFGLRSIYLWGSILTSDFDPLKGDIDSIGIAEDIVPLEAESSIQQKLKEYFPEAKRFSFRLLYISELSGKPTQSFLANVLDPRTLLFDMKYWKLISGESFSVSDFTDNPPSSEEVLSLRIKRIHRDNWLDLNEIKEDQVMYYLKNFMRMIWDQQNMRSFEKPFSYSGITRDATDRELEAIKAFQIIKDANWSKSKFLKCSNLFSTYLKDLN